MTNETYAMVLAAGKKALIEHIEDLARSDPKGAINYARNLACAMLRASGLEIVDSCSVHEKAVSILITDSETYGGEDA